MATELKLPRLGQGMESGTIVRWLKAEGDTVQKSEPLYELDTDKVTQEVEAETDGVLVKIIVAAGEVAVAMIAEGGAAPGEDVEAIVSDTPESDDHESSDQASAPIEPPEPAATSPAGTGAPAASAAAAVAAPVASAPVASTPGARIKASPLARRIARERGIDLGSVAGTGPDGRIVAEDVERAETVTAPPVAPGLASEVEVEVVAMTSIRKTIARRLTEAWEAPVFQLGVSIDMTEALQLREQIVARLGEGDVKPTLNDFLTRVVGVALVRHRAINATFDGEAIRRHPAAHVGIAVAAPNGLMVPVIRDADRRSVQEIAVSRADLVSRAREGKLTLGDMEGGTFTISNLGMFGVEEFVAVLNPPQVAILAVGAIKPTPVVVDGEIDIAPLMHATLTCDHRAIDGADGAEFLRTLVALVEQPALAL